MRNVYTKNLLHCLEVYNVFIVHLTDIIFYKV